MAWQSTGAEVDRVKTGLREERVPSSMYRKNKIRKTGIKSKESRNGQIKNYLLRRYMEEIH